MPYFRSRHLALSSPLGHFNGDNARLSPNHQTHKTHGDSKVHFLQRQTWLSLNYCEHNPSHVPRYALLSQLYHISISSLTHNLPTRLAAQKQTKYSMLQIKTILKNTFRLSASYFFILPLLPYKLSEETTQRKHTHAR